MIPMVARAVAMAAMHTATEPDVHPGADKVGGTLNRVWLLREVANFGRWVIDKLTGNVPRFVHTIGVTVKGGPLADIRRIWYMALSAAFGKIRNRPPGSGPFELRGTWDITGKSCSVLMSYARQGRLNAITAAGGAIYNSLPVFWRGPEQLTVGGSWPSMMFGLKDELATTWAGKVMGGVVRAVGESTVVGTINPTLTVSYLLFRGFMAIIDTPSKKPKALTIGGTIDEVIETKIKPCSITSPSAIPLIDNQHQVVDHWREVRFAEDSVARYSFSVTTATLPSLRLSFSRPAKDSGIPILPDDGRIITTGEKFDPNIQNPRPVVDGLSRDSILALVAQALNQPCYLPAPVPCEVQPRLQTGIFAYPPGSNLNPSGKYADIVHGQPIPYNQMTQPPITPRPNTIDGYVDTASPIPNVRGTN